jgi:Excalibur calcium-binding domain
MPVTALHALIYSEDAELAHAVDHHAIGSPRVTTFLHSDRLYRIAMSYNRGLDRDKDGIACEKA